MPAYITAGEVFTGVAPGKSVTPTRLNNHVSGLTILPSFIDTQPALLGANAVLASDKVLVFDASATPPAGLVSMTLAEFFASQVVDAAVGTGSLRTIGTGAQAAAPGNFRTLNNVFTGVDQQIKHLIGSGGTSIAPNSAGLGTGGSVGAIVTAGSSDLAGRINLTTGSSAGGTAAIAATVTFAAAWTHAPWVFLLPYGANAWGAQAGTKVLTVTGGTTTTFDITTGSVALATSTNYTYIYLCISGP